MCAFSCNMQRTLCVKNLIFFIVINSKILKLQSSKKSSKAAIRVAAIRVAATFAALELHVCNCKDWVWIIHSSGNTGFPIFHHERPISNPHVHPYVVRRTNGPPIGNAFADPSHQGKDWHSSKARRHIPIQYPRYAQAETSLNYTHPESCFGPRKWFSPENSPIFFGSDRVGLNYFSGRVGSD
jgi:hypothetical protein